MEERERERDQGEADLDRTAARATRARVLIGMATAVMVVSGFIYLRTSPGTRSPPVTALPPSQATFRYLEWASEKNGWLVMGEFGQPSTVLFRTVDGGHHWQRLRSAHDGLLLASFVDSRHGVLQVQNPFQGRDSGPVLQTV